MPRSYVDNSYNRSLGRVGMPVGSMVVSRSSGGGGGGGSYGGSSGGFAGSSGFSFGGGGGGAYASGGSSSSSSSRTYVDNAFNRQHGRVGLPHGEAVISRSGNSGSHSASSSSSRTYVDNAYNRQHGRVGLPHGEAVISRSGSARSDRSSSSGTYVDNAYNRQHGRVGLPYGEAVISKSGKSQSSASSSGTTTYVNDFDTKRYVDNAYNRKHGRVGLLHGEAVISKSGQPQSTPSKTRYKPDVSQDSGLGHSPKVYKDNVLNRRLGRAGKPLGTHVVSRSGCSARGANPELQVYADNAENRRLGRVGKPRGSMPHSRVSEQTEKARDLQKQIWDGKLDVDLDYDYEGADDAEMAIAMSEINRRLEELRWLEAEGTQRVKTSSSVLDLYTGVEIRFDELQLGRKIGQGGFGDVFFAKWNSSVVAVKKLRVQRVSRKRRDDFAKEVIMFCDLDHPNIVKFIGACLKTPNLCIVMEYMQTCLYTALHMNDDDIEFSEAEKLMIIQQTSDGMSYLHENRIAHCDLKSQNVLLDYEPGVSCVAKITDFGLSMMKSNSESSVSAMEQVRNVGTPRYSSPEVLRGEMLSAKAMMRADVYSFGLIVFEVLYKDEPYYGYNYGQLQKQVGQHGATPDIPHDSTPVNAGIQDIMKECWHYNPKMRPGMSEVSQILKLQTWLFTEKEDADNAYYNESSSSSDY